jgi:hypothetical protein
MYPPHSYLVPAIGVVILTACQSADRHQKSDTTAVATQAAPVINIVTVHANDYGYQAPASIPSGMTTFQLINDGPGFHHLTIVRLDSAKTLTDLLAAMKHPGPLPAWAVLAGGPNAPNPHDTSDATVDLSPGQYALMCFVDVPGGIPHFARGMSAPLTVTPASGAIAPAPTADVTVTLSDYAFDVTGPLATAGTHTILVRSGPGQPHELALVRLSPGKSAAQLAKWIDHMQGPPPGSPIGGATPAAPNVPVYFTVNLTPGTYALMCFLPAPDGKRHTAHGMMKTITVT